MLLALACSCSKRSPATSLSDLEKKKARAAEVATQVNSLLEVKLPNFGGLGADVLGLTAAAKDGTDSYSTLTKIPTIPPTRGEGASVQIEEEPAAKLEGDGRLTPGRYFASLRDETGRPCVVLRYTVRKRDQTFHVMIALAP